MRAVEWRAVPGFPDVEVSEDGRLRSLISGRELKLRQRETGHLFVDVNRPRLGYQRKLYVHAAVLLAFVGPRPAGHETRHLDGDPTNNVVANLAWGTRHENARDRVLHGGYARGTAVVTSKLTNRRVRAIRAAAERGVSDRALARRFGVSHTTIRKVRLRLYWAHVT